MSNRTVLYHRDCADGFCAAWLIWRYLDHDATFIPVAYGEPAPDLIGRDVMILDFSYPREVMEEIHNRTNALICLDHHKSAQKALEGLPYCIFDMERSGGQLTCDWLLNEKAFPLKDRPWLVDYTADRDLWKWELRRSREVNAVVRSLPFQFSVWEGLNKRDPLSWGFLGEGEAILRSESKIVADHVARAHEIELDEHRVLAVNCSALNLVSEIAGELAQERPFGAAWVDLPTDRGWVRKWSLRSREGGLDVSEIAAKWEGGGGHAKAAGFTELAEDPSPKIID